MQPSLVPGLIHETDLPVGRDLTVPRVSPRLEAFADMPEVFATAFLVALVEATSVALMRPHLSPGEHSVGIHVDLSHDAPTPLGGTVRARVELGAVEGRLLTFRAAVADDAGPIGAGLHRRAVIDVARFAARTAARARTAG
jgi:fluoroacetyl-CoA thioesterase